MDDKVMTSEIVKADRSVTPMELIQVAMNQNADVDKLEKLMELQLRWEANEAKKAYMAAMNEFKAERVEIHKNKHVSYETSKGTTSYRHATLDNVCDEITEPLRKHGISHRWKTAQANGKVKVTCVLTHFLGHSEETELEASPDDTGSKNAIQAIGSTVTYLQRYTLLAATGLAATDDNDAASAPVFEKLQEFLDSISTAPNLGILDKTFKGAFQEAMKSGHSQAMKEIVKAKDIRKAQLQEAL